MLSQIDGECHEQIKPAGEADWRRAEGKRND